MRFCRFIISVLACFLYASEGHAQAGSLSSTMDYWRHYRQYWNSYYSAKAAGKKLDYWLRSETAFGIVPGGGAFHIERHYEDVDAHYAFDTSVGMVLRPKHAYVITGTTGHPITRMSENASLIFTYGVNVRLTRYDIDPLKMGNYTTNFIFTNMDMGVPLSIDFKSGGEATLDKSKRFCFTLGAGLEPLWISGRMNLEYSYSKLHMYPFVKAEAGYLARFAGFKLRLSYLAGGYTQFEAEDVLQGSQVKLTNDNQLCISLVILNMVNQWE